MVFNLEHEMTSADILFPRTLVIEELGVLAVFTAKDECIILLAERQPDEDINLIAGAVSYGLDILVGNSFNGVLNMHKKVNNKYSWKHAAEEGLIWNIKHGIVGWQNGDEVTIVDSLGSTNSLLHEKVDVGEFDWCTVIEFVATINSTVKILVNPITHDEMVLFDTPQQLQDYLEMVTVHKINKKDNGIYNPPSFPDDFKMEFPMVQSLHYAFPLSDTASLMKNRSALGKLMSFEEWKASRE